MPGTPRDSTHDYEPIASARRVTWGKTIHSTPAPRQLLLTEAGRLVYRYAEEIFSPLAKEMTNALKGQAP